MDTEVLIVEDNENIVKLLKINLNGAGLNVDVACDGKEGLQKILMQENHPDVVILDIGLPYIDGYKVCREIKNNPKTKKIPVIILTAAKENTVYEKAKAAGCDLYLTKPFDPVSLVDTVTLVINNRRNKVLSD